ncbi:MAG: NUDIX domain-containing protein [Sphaerochaetaceae bacterium]|nr:NUDIX domain-containing protein [Sphaerochaetaceae bacterium]
MDERKTTAGVLVKNGRTFIAKRIQEGSVGGLWEFVGGKNRYEETLIDTLKREFMEELNVEVKVKDKICSYDFVNKEVLYHLNIFFVEVDSWENLRLRNHSEVEWVSFEELLKRDFVPSDKACFSRIIEALQAKKF